MQSFTLSQWAIVVLVFVAGWLLGLASHPGGRKWRERYAAERDAHAQARRDADARVAALETQHREALAQREQIAHEDARLAQSDRITIAPGRPATAAPVRVDHAPGERRGWFEFGPRRV